MSQPVTTDALYALYMHPGPEQKLNFQNVDNDMDIEIKFPNAIK